MAQKTNLIEGCSQKIYHDLLPVYMKHISKINMFSCNIIGQFFMHFKINFLKRSLCINNHLCLMADIFMGL